MTEHESARRALYPDFEEPAAAPGWRRAARVAGGFLLGAAGGALAAKLVLDGGWLPALGGAGAVAMLCAFGLSLWPQILLHEAGHVVAGLAGGMRAVAFGVGPWRFERGRAGWRSRRGPAIAGIAGFAALVPATRRGHGRAAQALYALGGPAANLLAAAVAAAIAVRLASSPVAVGAWIGIAAAGLGPGALNLVPFRTHGWRSDGMALLDLLRGAPDAALLQRGQSATALAMAGVRPRDWPETLLPEPAQVARASDTVATMMRLLQLGRAMDREDAPAARASAEALVAGARTLPPAFRPQVAVAMASYAVAYSDDDALLDAWRGLCKGGVFDLSPFLHWIDAERALRRGDADGAARGLDLARASLDRVQDPASAELLAERIDRLELRLPAGAQKPRRRQADLTPGPAPADDDVKLA